jgi:hypothetical protein
MRKNLLIIGTLSLAVLSVACGRRVSVASTNSSQQPATEEKAPSEAAIGDSSFMLDLPEEMKAGRDVLKVRLEGATGLAFERKFILEKGPILIEKLPAGDYKITIELMALGIVKERGLGSVTVEAKKLAQAEITLDTHEKATGAVLVKIKKPLEIEPAQLEQKLLPLLTAETVSVSVEEAQALPGCSGFRFDYSRKSAEIKARVCAPVAVACVPEVKCEGKMAFEEKQYAVKLSDYQRVIVEKAMSFAQYVPLGEVRAAIACIPAVGAKTRTVTTENADGKKIVLSAEMPQCASNAMGLLRPEIFEFVSKTLASMSTIVKILPVPEVIITAPKSAPAAAVPTPTQNLHK